MYYKIQPSLDSRCGWYSAIRAFRSICFPRSFIWWCRVRGRLLIRCHCSRAVWRRIKRLRLSILRWWVVWVDLLVGWWPLPRVGWGALCCTSRDSCGRCYSPFYDSPTAVNSSPAPASDDKAHGNQENKKKRSKYWAHDNRGWIVTIFIRLLAFSETTAFPVSTIRVDRTRKSKAVRARFALIIATTFLARTIGVYCTIPADAIWTVNTFIVAADVVWTHAATIACAPTIASST